MLGIEEESDSDSSESEFSSIDSDNDMDESEDEILSDQEETEEGANFQRGDRCSFCPHGQKKWFNAQIMKYRYPNQFTLQIEGSGRVCLGIKREQLHLPFKVVPASKFLSYKRSEIVDVFRKKKIRKHEYFGGSDATN